MARPNGLQRCLEFQVEDSLGKTCAQLFIRSAFAGIEVVKSYLVLHPGIVAN